MRKHKQRNRTTFLMLTVSFLSMFGILLLAHWFDTHPH